MITKHVSYLIFISIAFLSLQSCKKEKNSTISFWTKSSDGIISIKINGETKDLSYHWPEEPNCNDPKQARFDMPAGNYSYSATSTAGDSWNGSINLPENTCLSNELIVSPNNPPTNFDNQGTIIVKSRNLKIGVWDGATVDNDKMNIVFNGSTIASNLEIFAAKQYFNLNNIPTNSWLGIIAISEGTIPPCTPDIEIYDGFTTQRFSVRSYINGPGAYALKVQL